MNFFHFAQVIDGDLNLIFWVEELLNWSNIKMTQEQNHLQEKQVTQNGYISYLGIILQERVELLLYFHLLITNIFCSLKFRLKYCKIATKNIHFWNIYLFKYHEKCDLVYDILFGKILRHMADRF